MKNFEIDISDKTSGLRVLLFSYNEGDLFHFPRLKTTSDNSGCFLVLAYRILAPNIIDNKIRDTIVSLKTPGLSFFVDD